MCFSILWSCKIVELERAENGTVYKESGKTITVTREKSTDKKLDFSTFVEALIRLVENEEKAKEND